MRSRPLAVVAALPEELAGFGGHRSLLPAQAVREVRLGERRVVLCVLGDGAARASERLHRVIDAVSPTAVLLVGLAGAADRSLGVGEVRGAQLLQQADASPWPISTQARAWLEAAGLGPARVISVPRLLATSAEKRALARRHPGPLPLLVDLESWAVARAAANAGLPWAVVRAVSDACDEELPPCLLRAQEPDGRIRRGELAMRAMVSPREWVALGRLRARARRCARVLAEAVEALIPEMPAG